MVTKINKPCIEDIIIRSDGEVDLCFTVKDGQDETKLFPKPGDEDVMFTVEIGDVSGIGFGGTDNWGKNRLPLFIGPDAGNITYDSVFVDTIEIQEQSGWCKAELINNGKTIKYTALSTNPSNTERTAYFYFKTKDDTIKAGYNEGRPAAKEWYVTVIQEANPDAKPDPTPTPEPDKKDLGNYKYSVGVISDPHICKNNSGTTDNWWDEDDFNRVMSLYVGNPNIKFVVSCGDLSESQTNDYKKHPEATCNADYAEFKELYDVSYWQTAGLRFFSPLGNHDFYGLFESRVGDTITGQKNTECSTGYNASVGSRISELWPTGQQINGIVPGRGRIVFELETGKHTEQGQADMRFFSYNDYVDLYAKAGGYTGSSIWDSTKGGISDEAIKCAKNYVNGNWEKVKNNLVMWNNGGGHGRNVYSKLNYWLKKEDDIYIFLSLDYGNDIWGITSGWHDRMIHARTIINLEEDDPYVKRMKEFVGDTEYSEADKLYNYQYYSPNTLIWLKELVENNQDKKIYIFSHHFMPSRVGNGVGRAKDGNWFYSVISPDGVKEDGGINKGSNALTGIEYWFFNKLMNLYKNVIWFSGHSHISFSSGANFDNHEYRIVGPSEKNEYVYTKESTTPVKESAWCVALPSLSKPRGIVNGQSVRLYEDAEMGIMEIYEKGVVIKGYKVKENNKDVEKLLTEKTIKLI